MTRKLHFDVFDVDLDAGELCRQGRRLKLQEQPFRVLSVLLEKPGEVATREELRQRLWPADTFVDFDHSLNIAINKLRETLGDSAERPRFIETLPRRGYRFLLPVEAVAPATPTAREAAPPRVWTRPRIALGLAALAVLAVVLVWQFALRRGHAGDSAAIRSLAVLPLENLSRDPEQEYFADGMTDELITDLGKISGLRVISRTSVMHYKGTKRPLPEIAHELNVDAVVEGTVARAGDRVRVRAQLIRAATDQHIWAESYDRDLRDILALQGEVAADIARQVQVRLTPQEQARLARARPTDPAAYDAYLRGRYFWTKRTERALRKAIEYFQEAIEKDPSYAPAYSGLADCYSILAVYTFIPPQEGFPKAKAAATKALELDDQLAEGHTSMGIVHERLDWDGAGSDRELRRAIELNPGYATAYHWHSYFLHRMGRFEESAAEMRRALELDPFSLSINVSVGTVFLYARKYDEASAQFRKSLELDPNFVLAHSQLGRTYEQEKMFEAALAEFQEAATLSENLPRFRAELAHGYAAAGRQREARQILRELQNESRKRYVSPFDLAYVYAALGDKDKAFLLLEQAYQERSAWLPWVNRDPRFDPLRPDPRFADLARRMGLPP